MVCVWHEVCGNSRKWHDRHGVLLEEPPAYSQRAETGGADWKGIGRRDQEKKNMQEDPTMKSISRCIVIEIVN